MTGWEEDSPAPGPVEPRWVGVQATCDPGAGSQLLLTPFNVQEETGGGRLSKAGVEAACFRSQAAHLPPAGDPQRAAE